MVIVKDKEYSEGGCNFLFGLGFLIVIHGKEKCKYFPISLWAVLFVSRPPWEVCSWTIQLNFVQDVVLGEEVLAVSRRYGTSSCWPIVSAASTSVHMVSRAFLCLVLRLYTAWMHDDLVGTTKILGSLSFQSQRNKNQASCLVTGRLVTVTSNKSRSFTSLLPRHWSCGYDRSVQNFRYNWVKYNILSLIWPPLWSNGQNFWLQIHRSGVRFPPLRTTMRNCGSGAGSTQPREYNWGAT
jgi:hypothetical protein